MQNLPIHSSFAVVDIQGFGTRTDPDQRWLRDRLYSILAAAAERAGIPRSTYDMVDRGDGVALLIPASVSVSKLIIAEAFTRMLLAELKAHNSRSKGPAVMRLRMSLHAGEVSRDDNGWVGSALNTACRLVDLPELRAALVENPDADLVICVSELWFQTVVRHDHGVLDPGTYSSIDVRAKEVEGRAWLHVPGLPAPSRSNRDGRDASLTPRGEG